MFLNQLSFRSFNISHKLNNLARSWKLVILIIAVGLFIGTAVALATKVFVNSILYLTDLRENASIFKTKIMGIDLNFAPVITLLIAALVINLVKKYAKITRFHGPEDSIY